MHAVSSLALGFLSSASVASAQIGCATSSPSLAFRSISEQLSGEAKRSQVDWEPITVKTYVHVVADDDTIEGGYYGADIIESEIEVLNVAFAPHGFSFHLVSTSWTINEYWTNPNPHPSNPAGSNETEMRTALTKGGYADLNLFFLPHLVPGGRCELPLPNPTSDDLNMNGCVVRSQPEDPSQVEFNNVIIHEVGHWLGLLHTFDNGCEEPGDFVDDTPAEAYPAQGEPGTCPEEGRNTCPDRPGVDPIDNYMTYVN